MLCSCSAMKHRVHLLSLLRLQLPTVLRARVYYTPLGPQRTRTITTACFPSLVFVPGAYPSVLFASPRHDPLSAKKTRIFTTALRRKRRKSQKRQGKTFTLTNSRISSPYLLSFRLPLVLHVATPLPSLLRLYPQSSMFLNRSPGVVAGTRSPFLFSLPPLPLFPLSLQSRLFFWHRQPLKSQLSAGSAMLIHFPIILRHRHLSLAHSLEWQYPWISRIASFLKKALIPLLVDRPPTSRFTMQRTQTLTLDLLSPALPPLASIHSRLQSQKPLFLQCAAK